MLTNSRENYPSDVLDNIRHKTVNLHCKGSVNREHVRIIVTAIVIRLAGLVAVVGGLAATTLGLLYVFQSRGMVLDFTAIALLKGHYDGPAGTMLLVGVLVAIPALHFIEKRHYGGWGALFSVAAFVGLVLIPAGWFMPSVAVGAPLAIAGVLAASVGVVGLGIVTISSGVLPRWCGVALIAGSPPGVGTLFLFSSPLAMAGILPGEIAWALVGIPWVVLGYAIFRAKTQQSARPARVR